MSSNGRTAVSGTVCEGSTPSTPATKQLMASSSSGLGRRPLKAEIAGSNPVEATRISSLHNLQAFFIPQYVVLFHNALAHSAV